MRFGWRFVLVCVVVAVATHLPSLLRTEVINPDEAFVATQAQVLNDGGELYEDVVDRKPPILPYIYAAAFRLTGSDSLLPLRVLALGMHMATALLLAAIARDRWGDRAALAAPLLYLVASGGLQVEDSQAAGFEVFMLPPTVLAIWLGQRQRFAAAGIAAAVATLTKQVAGTTLVPLALLAGRRKLLPLTAAFAGSIAATAIVFGWHDFWFWVVSGNGGYLDASGDWHAVGQRALESGRLFLYANIAAAALAVAALRRWRDELDLWLWLLGAAIGVAAGFRFFGHYYLQLMPPVALLAAGTLAKAWRPVVALSAVVATISVAVFAHDGMTQPLPVLRPYDEVAAAIATYSDADDRIFVWGHLPEAYWASDRRPATRFLTSGFLTGYSGGRSVSRVGPEFAVPGTWAQLEADLTANPPELIVDAAVGSSFPLERYPQLARYVEANYEQVAKADFAVLYRRCVRSPCGQPAGYTGGVIRG